MHISNHALLKPKSPAQKPNFKPTVRRWLSFFVGITLIAAGVYSYITLLALVPGTKEHIELLKEGNYRAGAYFYTDVDQVGKAEQYINDSHQYEPQKRP